MTSPDRPSAPSLPDSSLAAARDRAMQALSLHFAHDHLTTEELDDRLGRAARASSDAELRALLADLPGGATPAALHSAPLPAGPEDVPARGRIVAFLGGAMRKGSWIVPRSLRVRAVLGGVVLDLREATFAVGLTEIDVTAVMGGVSIVVPPGVRVESMGSAFLGGFESREGDSFGDGGSGVVLRVTGIAFMGGVEVKVARPGDPPED
jgi:hypothetical protein